MNPSEPAPRHAVVGRFDGPQRWAHRGFALLMGISLVTAALLYIPGLGGVVGQRDVVRIVHQVAGFGLPIPLLLGYGLSALFRRDVERLNRFNANDAHWLRRGERRISNHGVGKFNAGQKLNSAFTAGALLVMLATGSVMTFATYVPDDVRTGATFTHGWFAIAIAMVLAGHVWMAYGDPEARVGMRTGDVRASWAQVHHPAWDPESDVAVSKGKRPKATNPAVRYESRK